MLHATILEFTNISAFYFGLVIKKNSNHTWEKTFNLPKIYVENLEDKNYFPEMIFKNEKYFLIKF